MSLTTILRAGLLATLIGAADLAANKAELVAADWPDIKLPSGTAAGKADLLFADQRTISASSSEDLDLAGGLSDPLGQTLTFVKVKAILIRAAEGNTNNVVVGGASSNQFQGPFGDVADTLSIPPGGFIFLAAPSAGWTVTAGSGDLLKIANSGGSAGVTYDIAIIGTSA